LAPGYEQKKFPAEEKQGKLRLIASRGADDGSIHINQDVRLYASISSAGDKFVYALGKGRHAWLQLISGSLDVNGTPLAAGDGAAINDEPSLDIQIKAASSEFLLFDLN
jgi:redox-sensitive bicupin YhaK (pirin superfamily)